MNIPLGYFKRKYEQLRGKDWIRRIEPEDRVALAHVAFVASDYGRSGGRARAQTATRDRKGRFAKK